MTLHLPPPDVDTSSQTPIPLNLTCKDLAKSSETPEEGTRRRFQLSKKTFFLSLATILPLLTIITILEVVFTEVSANADITNWQTWEVPNGKGSLRSGMDGAPYAFFNWPFHNTFQLASSYFSLAICCIGAGLWWHSWKKGPFKTTYVRRFSILITFGLNVLLAFGSAIYVLTIHGISAQFDMNYVISSTEKSDFFKYSQGTFDVESWACGVKDLPGFDKDGVVHRTCSLEMGARILTIFTFLFSAALFGLVWVDWRGGRNLMQTWKNRRASWRNDYY